MKKVQKILIIIILGTIMLPASFLSRSVRAAYPDQAAQPLLYVYDYSPGPGEAVSPWQPFTFDFAIANNGNAWAYNFVMTFESTDFIPLDGGVFTAQDIGPGDSSSEYVGKKLRFRVSDEGSWKYSGILRAVATYTDAAGTAYSSTFTFNIAIMQEPISSATKTPTPGPMDTPQLVVSGYSTDLNPLQPGSQFKLSMDIINLGNVDAKSVSLVYGGGVNLSLNEFGTPTAGGIPGTGGDLVNFAPIGNSNVELLGDLPVNAQVKSEQEFVVNVTTVPGAYPLKVSLVYTDPKGNRLVDDQVITLLVYSLPQLEISFYQDPGVINAGFTTMLPIQVTNLAKKTVVLGNMAVVSTTGEILNGTSLVGSLDPGGYYTYDVSYSPFEEGTDVIHIEISYTDDFNQLRVYQSSLEVSVQPAAEFPVEPMPGEGEIPPVEEPIQKAGFWATLWSALKGFLGFGISKSENTTETPVDEGGNFIPVPGGLKGY